MPWQPAERKAHGRCDAMAAADGTSTQKGCASIAYREWTNPAPAARLEEQCDQKGGHEMSQSELYTRGVAMRRELYGEAAADRSARDIYTDPMMKKFLDVATENVFGALWTRPGLDLKTRTMICVASDVATGRKPELAIHLRF